MSIRDIRTRGGKVLLDRGIPGTRVPDLCDTFSVIARKVIGPTDDKVRKLVFSNFWELYNAWAEAEGLVKIDARYL